MPLTQHPVSFDYGLLQRYNQAIPRYTSYPPATELKDTFGASEFAQAIDLSNQDDAPLSLYCHIPFCETPCYFCGCNTVITQRKEVAQPYLHYLKHHIRQVQQKIAPGRLVQQIHWGGGTPNYFSLDQVEALWRALHDAFTVAKDAELSIEVNPRFLDRHYVQSLGDLGFNRISFGIQDFHPMVQEAINRIQPLAMLTETMDWLKEAGFNSINVDLVYGLPFQTLESFRDTVRKTIALDPDRIAVFNFAYVPWLKPVQKRLPIDAMPAPEEKLQILQMTIEELTNHGYVFIGMDHFAKPGDELAIAQARGELHRNFQGYTTQPESDLFGFGMTSISMLRHAYAQNQKRLPAFYRAIEKDELPIERGFFLSEEDQLRRLVIMELMCQFSLDKAHFEAKYRQSLVGELWQYFGEEYEALQPLAADGLVHLSADRLEVTPVGRLLIRNVAAVFDTYLRSDRRDPHGRFSRAI